MGVFCDDICPYENVKRKSNNIFDKRNKKEKAVIEKDILKRKKEILKRETEKGFYDKNNKFINEKSNLFNSKNEEEKFSEKNKIANDSIESKISVKINTNYFYRENESIVDFDLNKINNLSGLLKLLFLKYISITINEKIMEIKNNNLIRILQSLNKDLELINKKGIIKNEEYLSKDVEVILKEKEGSNIIEYAKYIDSIIKTDEIEELINIHDLEQKENIFKFLKNIIKYEKYNTYFEKEFTKAQIESIFDYSIINLVLLDNKNFLKYEEAKKRCDNCTTKLLFHGTQIDPASKIISSEFKYTRRAFYGMGIYFTDNLDYTTFYSGGDQFKNRRENFNKICQPNSTFTFIASEIFYDKKKLKEIKDNSYYAKSLDYFPTYEEIKTKYKDKMVEKNGIHFIRVKSDHGNVLKDINSVEERKNGAFIVNEYVVTELEQICPLYAIKIKRNEYFLLWRDLNFKGKNFFSDYLKQRELYANGIAKMNIYIENNTENALKFIYKRRFNKMILITSIGLDFSGKKFIEIARKILGSNIIVLIYSSNKDHLKWIQNFTNVLYTNNSTIYKKFIKNYDEKGLKELKKEVEEIYNIKLLDFTNDFLSYPLYIENQKYPNINWSEKSPYIREVSIEYSKTDSILIMNDNGIFKMVSKSKAKEYPNWDITLINDELTLFSNGYYLGYDENSNKIVSDKYMRRWKFTITNNGRYIIKTNNNLLITISDNTLNLKPNDFCLHNDNSIFEFIDKN